jgi:hypothetical protein
MVSMKTSRFTFLRRLGLPVVLVTLIASPGLMSRAQNEQNQPPMLPGDFKPRVKKHKTPDKLPPVPTLSPAISISAAPLGYGPPGPTYLGRNQNLVALGFLDENHLLFSFRAPGLLSREDDVSSATTERQMHAIVLALPDGKVESKTVWTLQDRGPYLWFPRDGHFLLRDREGLKTGDATLQTKPLVPLPGGFLAMRLDPSGNFLLASSLDPAAHFDSTNAMGTRKVLPLATQIGPNPNPTNIAERLIQLESGKVLSTRHASSAAPRSINAEGFLDTVHEKADRWSLTLNSFNGGSRILGHVESTCLPTSFFASDREILVSGCTEGHIPKLMAVSVGGRLLWQIETPIAIVPPLYVVSQDGSRFARETVVFKHSPGADTQTPWVKAVKGQVVRVFDASTGKVVMETPISPTFDAGGNVALSPSGKRLAVLNAGAIEVFDLPAPVPLPDDVVH